LYVILANILFGCLGIWIEVVKTITAPTTAELAGIITAVIAFFPTLMGSTTLQLVLASAKRNDMIFVSFGLLVLCVSTAAAILLAIFSAAHPVAVLAIGITCSVGSIWMWWIANGGDPIYKSKSPPPDAPTGGDPSRSLGGDLSGYQA
jgi:hypothetical protein